MPMEPAKDRGFSTHGGGTRSQELAQPGVVQNMNELGYRQPFVAGLGAHGQLVAKISGRAVAHAGHAQVLAQGGRRLHVEVVQRNDAVDLLGARHVADAQQHVFHLPLLLHVRDVEGLVDALLWPRLVGDAMRGQQQHAGALAAALANEVKAFEVAGETEHGQRPVCRMVSG